MPLLGEWLLTVHPVRHRTPIWRDRQLLWPKDYLVQITRRWAREPIRN